MERLGLPAAVALAAWLAGCGSGGERTRGCEDSCPTQAGAMGQCLPSPHSTASFCAYPHPDCASGLRWNALAGDALADVCVEPMVDAGVTDAGGDASSLDAAPADAADVTPPTVVATEPAAAQTGIDPRAIVTVTFSEPIDAATVTATTFTLSCGGTIAGTVATAPGGLSATFTPMQPLPKSTPCSATLAVAIHDRAGLALAAPVSIGFTTHDRGWDAAALVEQASMEAQEPSLALNASGDGMVVYAQRESASLYSVVACRYGASGWSSPILVENDNLQIAINPEVAVDPAGNAVVVWMHRDFDQGPYSIMASRFTPAGGFGARIEIDASAERADDPMVRMDSAGNAVAVWTQASAGKQSIWAARLPAGGSWSAATLVESSDVDDASGPDLRIEPSGAAMVVFTQGSGTSWGLRGARMAAGGTWGAAVNIVADTEGAGAYPVLALDGAGNAIMLWTQRPYNFTADLRAVRFTLAGGWGSPVRLDTDDVGPETEPKVTLDGAGNGMAMWRHDTGSDSRVRVARFTLASGFAAPVVLEPRGWQSSDLAPGPGGEIHAVFTRWDGSRAHIWASRFDPATGFGVPVRLENNSLSSVLVPRLAIDGSRNGAVVWLQSDASGPSIYASRLR